MITTKQALSTWLQYDQETGIFTLAKVGTVRNWSRKKVGDAAGCVEPRGYIVLRVQRRKYYAHRLAWLWCHGELPSDGADIDHINGDKSDNRICNLRLATRAQNNQNQKRRVCASGLKGAHMTKGKWTSRITRPDGKQVYLGTFASKEDAHQAYVVAAEKFFGEFARAS